MEHQPVMREKRKIPSALVRSGGGAAQDRRRFHELVKEVTSGSE